jgi:hypothetical protein
MKKIYFFLFASFLFLNLQAQNLEAEKAAVQAVVQNAYIDGLQNEGDSVKINAGFHPDFKLLGIDKGEEMWKYPIKVWKKKQVEKRQKGDLPLKGDKFVTAKYQSIDITGDAAVVKLAYLVGGKKIYTDYLSLYKFGNKWKIVNKIFYKH